MPRQLPLIACLALSLPAAAQDDAQRLSQAVAADFTAGHYADAERDCQQLIALQPKEPAHRYNLACAQSRQGHADQAIVSLTAAVDLGYADAAHAQADDDLAALRPLPAFAKEVEAMRSKARTDGPVIEPGAGIAGVTTIERAPTGGLRYRLRLGTQATADKPHRLVVWLHPSGGSMDQAVEPLAPALAAHGFALMVFTQKQYRGWAPAEMVAIAPSINDASTIPGLDVRRPVLLGFSAGGQTALLLWRCNPEAFGGLMTTAAYPIDPKNPNAFLNAPPGDGARRTPILALVGGAEPNGFGERAWKLAEPSWRQAGVPLTLRVVKGRGHEFLFQGDEWTHALAWLDQLGAGASGDGGKQREAAAH
jgi:predicted esterase